MSLPPRDGALCEAGGATLLTLGALHTGKRAVSKLLLYRSATKHLQLVRWTERLALIDGIEPNEWSEVIDLVQLEDMLLSFTPAAGLLLPVVDHTFLDSFLGCTSAAWHQWTQQPRSSYTVATPAWFREVMTKLHTPASTPDGTDSTADGEATDAGESKMMCIGPGFLRQKVSRSPLSQVQALLASHR